MIKGKKKKGSEGEEHKIMIDIFPIENVPKNKLYCTIKGLYCHALMLIDSSVQRYESSEDSFWQQTKEGRSFLRRRRLIGKIFSFRSAQYWLNTADRACQYNKETGIVSIPTGRNHYFGEMQPTSTFFPMSKGTFEGHEVNLPGNPHAYLSKLYGDDYMTPPPLEKREKHYIQEIDFGDY